MLTIRLSGLSFHAYHGIYEEEKLIGGEYEVNASVFYNPKQTPVRHISEVVDYTSIYSLIKKRMDLPTPLLETVATEIAGDILTYFLEVEEVIVEIKKINPPIVGFQGSVSVVYDLKRNEK